MPSAFVHGPYLADLADAVGQPVPQRLQKAAAAGVLVDPAVRHTALGDARLARDVYDRVMSLGRRAVPREQVGHG